MIRRLFALLIAVLFWSIQTANACVVQVNAGSATISVQEDQADPGVQPSADTIVDDAGNDDGGAKGPASSCADSCCHSLHHAFLAASSANPKIESASDSFVLVQDARPETRTSQLNRPPLA